MVNPSDFLPEFIKDGNIAYEYLRKHLTDDQIFANLDYLNTPKTTYREAHSHITDEDGHPEIFFYALDSHGEGS